MDGVVNLDSSGHKVQIKPSAAGVAAIQSVDKVGVGAADVEYYKLVFRGCMTRSLAYNASVGDIKTELEGLRSFRNYEGQALTVTASGVMADGITFTFPSGIDVQDSVYVISEGVNVAGVELVFDTSVCVSDDSNVTRGKSGFTSGQYDVSVYALVYKSVHVKDGELSTEFTR
jgi:hypothetical protein